MAQHSGRLQDGQAPPPPPPPPPPQSSPSSRFLFASAMYEEEEDDEGIVGWVLMTVCAMEPLLVQRDLEMTLDGCMLIVGVAVRRGGMCQKVSLVHRTQGSGVVRMWVRIPARPNPIQSTFVKRHQSSCLFRGTSQKHRGKPLLLTISVLGSFTCITQHTGPTALRPIRRTKQLWLSVLLKDTSAATGNRTHILVF